MLNNAIKYTFRGEIKLIINDSIDNYNTIQITVEDTGIGIKQ